MGPHTDSSATTTERFVPLWTGPCRAVLGTCPCEPVKDAGSVFHWELPRTPVVPTKTPHREEAGFLMSSDDANLIELFGPREVIGRAIDALMDRDGVDRDAAFEQLVDGSSKSHRRVRDVAAEIVEQSTAE